MKRIRTKRNRQPDASQHAPGFASVLTAEQRAILERARPYTMLSLERLVACIDAVSYVTERGIPGAIVECGVWRGGAVVTMIGALQDRGVDDRDIYLFDTFEGMTLPSDADTSKFDEPALATWEKAEATNEKPWSVYFRSELFTFDEVKDVIYGTGYPRERIHFVAGRVEDTLPDEAPPEIAVLRLDTDWYESTKHELVHLYPRLSVGGVLIVDDYGHWDGCRRAVDEYFTTDAPPVLLSRIDYTGRIAIKH